MSLFTCISVCLCVMASCEAVSHWLVVNSVMRVWWNLRGRGGVCLAFFTPFERFNN